MTIGTSGAASGDGAGGGETLRFSGGAEAPDERLSATGEAGVGVAGVCSSAVELDVDDAGAVVVDSSALAGSACRAA